MPGPLLPESGTVDSHGCDVRWYAGGTGSPALVLVHGGAAHAGWWEPMLRGLTARHRVIALDLSGHGDSGRRPGGYPETAWVTDVVRTIEATTDTPVGLVGHSMGGRIAASVAARHPELLTALVTVDSVVPAHDHEPVPPPRPMKLYPSEAAVRAAFKLMPPQPPLADSSVLSRLARRSYRRREDGTYTWKWDPAVFADMSDRFVTTAEIHLIRCPVTIVRGGASAVTTPETAQRFIEQLGRPAELVTLAGAHHHIPLDSPAELEQILLQRFARESPMSHAAIL